MTLLKINRLLLIYISIVPLKFEVDIQSQSKVRVRKPKNSNMAARRPFWKWHRWKSIGFCLWPPSTCVWNLKLKFQSKLELCSGNHVVYRQTDGQTDRRTRWIQYTPPPTSLGGGIKMCYNRAWGFLFFFFFKVSLSKFFKSIIWESGMQKKTRYADATPTSEVTPFTIRYIRPPHHGHTNQYHDHEWMTHALFVPCQSATPFLR